MKRIILLIVTLLFFNLQAQETQETHHGFQFSIFAGGMIGDINAQIADLGGSVTMKGSRMNAKFHVGYAYHNWSAGFSFATTSMNVKSMVVGGVAYKMPIEATIDNTPVGFYFKRYFMPINIFVTTDLGISKFSFYDDKAKLQGETEIGFAWNIAVGKEILLGKRKRLGLGAYLNLSGIKCHDLPPYRQIDMLM